MENTHDILSNRSNINGAIIPLPNLFPPTLGFFRRQSNRAIFIPGADSVNSNVIDASLFIRD